MMVRMKSSSLYPCSSWIPSLPRTGCGKQFKANAFHRRKVGEGKVQAKSASIQVSPSVLTRSNWKPFTRNRFPSTWEITPEFPPAKYFPIKGHGVSDVSDQSGTHDGKSVRFRFGRQWE